MSPDPQKIGLFLVGARGSIATTVMHGLEGLRSGMSPLGLLTELPEFDGLPWPSLASFRIAGWDIAGDVHQTAAGLARTGVLPHDIVDLCSSTRERYALSIAPGLPDPRDAEMADSASRKRLDLPTSEAVQALREDIQEWMRAESCHHAVVVYLATAERDDPIPEAWQDFDRDPLSLLADAPATLSRSMLYATAAIAEGLPFINFTPAPGAAAPALAGFAARQGVPVLGNDGKTGETLVKTVLAPLFRDRALNVMAWEGYNMLGNRDGAALEDPERKSAKLRNKDVALGNILGPGSRHTGVSIDFVPSLHDWKTAWDFIHFEGFLGAQMTMEFTWRGSDSALAAPVVLDLARIALLAKQRGEGGAFAPAAAFFKAPLETQVHDFHRQMDVLRRWLAQAKPTEPPS